MGCVVLCVSCGYYMYYMLALTLSSVWLIVAPCVARGLNGVVVARSAVGNHVL